MIRSLLLKAEPWLFAALSPLLSGRKARYQRSLTIQRYCKGRGVEIGAFEQPVLVPRGSSATYVDRVPALHWKSHPEYAHLRIVEPDIIDDGLSLCTIADDRFDYLVAAHVLEHADDPISALKAWVRVVKPGGHVVVIVPDMRFVGEEKRPLTSFEHLLRDHEEGPHTSAEEHYRDIAVNMLGHTDEAQIVDLVARAPPAMHFHTWTLETFVSFLMKAAAYLGRPCELLDAQLNAGESIAVLKVLRAPATS